MPINLNNQELNEIRTAFSDLLNFESDDPTDPVDPLTYIEPDGDNCLHIAAHRGDYRSVDLLLRAGINVNSVGDMGCTALHYAVSKGHQDIVELLIERGASITLLNEFGRPPIDQKQD